MFEAPLTRMGLWNYALVLSAVCAEYIGMPSFSWIPDHDPAFLELVMDDLVRKGNLRRDEDSGVDTILVENTDSGGVGTGPVPVRLYKNLAQKTKYQWPVMNRAKVLIPFGVTAMCLKYGMGALTGKYRKIHPKQLMESAEQRKKLYGELKLFEGADKET